MGVTGVGVTGVGVGGGTGGGGVSFSSPIKVIVRNGLQ